MPEQTNFERAIREWWDGPGLVADLRDADWLETEPDRLDRRIYIGSSRFLEGLAKQATPKEEWADADENGFLNDIVDEYLEALVSWVAELMDEHVYAEDYEGDVFLGQYKEGEEKPSIPGVLDWWPAEE